MVQVKMHTIYAGPNGCCDAGKNHDVTEKEAAELVKRGFAVYHEAPKAAKAEEKALPAAETADLKTPEDASNAPQSRKKQVSA